MTEPKIGPDLLLLHASVTGGVSYIVAKDDGPGRDGLREKLAALVNGHGTLYARIFREDTEVLLERLVLTAGADRAATKGKKEGAS